MSHQIVALTRDCKVAEIPSGSLRVLSEGTSVVITQTLGGSYTITVGYGQLMRVDAKDADALGFTPARQPETAVEFSENAVWDQLKTIYDPEIPVNIVDLGLVYSCVITKQESGYNIAITMSMTAPGCGMGDVLKSDIEHKLNALPDVNCVNVKVVFDPPWTPRLMSEATRLQLGLDY